MSERISIASLPLLFPLLLAACGAGEAQAPDAGAGEATSEEARDDGPAPGLQRILEESRSASVLESLRDRAVRQVARDPEAAVAAMVRLAKKGSTAGSLWANTQGSLIEAIQPALERSPDPAGYLALGKSQFLLGRIQEAEASLTSALDRGLTDPIEHAEALCWASASARILGHPEEAERSIATARGILATRTTTRPRQESGDGLPPPNPSGFVPYSADGTILGLGRPRQNAGGPPTGAVNAGPNRVTREYLEAAADYRAEQARYEAEQRLANSRAGRLGALGIQINPRPVDQRIHLRYLNAKAAYEAQGGRAR